MFEKQAIFLDTDYNIIKQCHSDTSVAAVQTDFTCLHMIQTFTAGVQL